jgi:hypothetical protein
MPRIKSEMNLEISGNRVLEYSVFTVVTGTRIRIWYLVLALFFEGSIRYQMQQANFQNLHRSKNKVFGTVKMNGQNFFLRFLCDFLQVLKVKKCHFSDLIPIIKVKNWIFILQKYKIYLKYRYQIWKITLFYL